MQDIKKKGDRWTLPVLGMIIFLGFLYTVPRDSRPRATYQQFRTWNELWFSPDGALRSMYTEPAGDRLAAISVQVCAIAVEKGFEFSCPTFFQTTQAYHDEVPLAEEAKNGDPHIAVTQFGNNRVILSTGQMASLSDEELMVVVAHEVGHSVDGQTERLGHDLLREWSRLPSQLFADRFAMEIVGAEPVFKLRRRFPLDRYPYYMSTAPL